MSSSSSSSNFHPAVQKQMDDFAAKNQRELALFKKLLTLQSGREDLADDKAAETLVTDGKQEKDAKDNPWSGATLLQTRGALRTILVGSGKLRAAKKGHKAFKVMEGDVMSGVLNFATSAGGVMQGYSGVNSIVQTGTGALAVTSTPDFASFANLFDVFRVIGLVIEYQPIGSGQTNSAGVVAIHVPMLWIADPDAVTSGSFNTLMGQRLITVKNNHFTNTGVKNKKSFDFKVVDNILVNNNASTSGSIGTWFSTSLGSQVIVGGLLVSAQTNTTNVSTTYGVARVQWRVQWGERL